jgi:hypothetical protein
VAACSGLRGMEQGWALDFFRLASGRAG